MDVVRSPTILTIECVLSRPFREARPRHVRERQVAGINSDSSSSQVSLSGRVIPRGHGRAVDTSPRWRHRKASDIERGGYQIVEIQGGRIAYRHTDVPSTDPKLPQPTKQVDIGWQKPMKTEAARKTKPREAHGVTDASAPWHADAKQQWDDHPPLRHANAKQQRRGKPPKVKAKGPVAQVRVKAGTKTASKKRIQRQIHNDQKYEKAVSEESEYFEEDHLQRASEDMDKSDSGVSSEAAMHQSDHRRDQATWDAAMKGDENWNWGDQWGEEWQQQHYGNGGSDWAGWKGAKAEQREGEERQEGGETEKPVMTSSAHDEYEEEESGSPNEEEYEEEEEVSEEASAAAAESRLASSEYSSAGHPVGVGGHTPQSQEERRSAYSEEEEEEEAEEVTYSDESGINSLDYIDPHENRRRGIDSSSGSADLHPRQKEKLSEWGRYAAAAKTGSRQSEEDMEPERNQYEEDTDSRQKREASPPPSRSSSESFQQRNPKKKKSATRAHFEANARQEIRKVWNEVPRSPRVHIDLNKKHFSPRSPDRDSAAAAAAAKYKPHLPPPQLGSRALAGSSKSLGFRSSPPGVSRDPEELLASIERQTRRLNLAMQNAKLARLEIDKGLANKIGRQQLMTSAPLAFENVFTPLHLPSSDTYPDLAATNFRRPRLMPTPNFARLLDPNPELRDLPPPGEDQYPELQQQQQPRSPHCHSPQIDASYFGADTGKAKVTKERPDTSDIEELRKQFAYSPPRIERRPILAPQKSPDRWAPRVLPQPPLDTSPASQLNFPLTRPKAKSDYEAPSNARHDYTQSFGFSVNGDNMGAVRPIRASAIDRDIAVPPPLGKTRLRVGPAWPENSLFRDVLLGIREEQEEEEDEPRTSGLRKDLSSALGEMAEGDLWVSPTHRRTQPISPLTSPATRNAGINAAAANEEAAKKRDTVSRHEMSTQTETAAEKRFLSGESFLPEKGRHTSVERGPFPSIQESAFSAQGSHIHPYPEHPHYSGMPGVYPSPACPTMMLSFPQMTLPPAPPPPIMPMRAVPPLLPPPSHVFDLRPDEDRDANSPPLGRGLEVKPPKLTGWNTRVLGSGVEVSAEEDVCLARRKFSQHLEEVKNRSTVLLGNGACQEYRFTDRNDETHTALSFSLEVVSALPSDDSSLFPGLGFSAESPLSLGTAPESALDIGKAVVVGYSDGVLASCGELYEPQGNQLAHLVLVEGDVVTVMLILRSKSRPEFVIYVNRECVFRRSFRFQPAEKVVPPVWPVVDLKGGVESVRLLRDPRPTLTAAT